MFFEILDTILYVFIADRIGDRCEKNAREEYPEIFDGLDKHLENEPLHKFFKKIDEYIQNTFIYRFFKRFF